MNSADGQQAGCAGTDIARADWSDPASGRGDDGVVVFEPGGLIRAFDTGASRIFGFAPDEAVGRALADLLPGFRGNAGQARDVVGVARDGSRLSLHVTVNPLTLDGAPLNVAMVREAGRQQRMEAELRRLAGAVQHSPASVVITDADSVITFVNPKFSEVTGYDASEVVGRTPRALKSGHTPAETYAELWRTVKAGHVWRGEFINRKKNGDLYWEAAAIAPVMDPDGRISDFVAVKEDITERKRAEDALRRSERDIRTILDNMTDTFYRTDGEGRLLMASRSAETLLGYGVDALLGMNLADLYADPADRERFLADLAEQGGRLAGYESCLRRKDGRRVWVSTNAHYYRDDSGEIAGVEGTTRDITRMKEHAAELEKAKNAAEAANKAKSDFLSGMSHELRTPLNAILGFGQLLQYDQTTPLTESQQEHVGLILRSGAHLLDLVNEVLDLASIEAGKVRLSIERVVPADLAAECLDLIRPLADKRSITLVDAVDGADLPAMRADYTRLKQVVVNLLSNAVKYNVEGGRVTVSTMPAGADHLRIAVSDTGPGIPPERIGQLFEPFERLEAARGDVEGSGIGLTLTKRLVELMGGSIGVDSQPGQGSTFRVDLPLERRHRPRETERDRGAVETAQFSWERADLPGGFTMLYVEDNPDSLRLMGEIADRLPDVELLVAGSAESGFEMAVEHRPDLILMDIDLPAADGFAAFERLQADPATREIPVLALSANPQERDRGLAAGFRDYLAKPVDLQGLLGALAAVLEGR